MKNLASKISKSQFLKPKHILILFVCLIAAAVGLIVLYKMQLRSLPFVQKLRGRLTSEDQVTLYGEAARARLRTIFDTTPKKIWYPPAKLLLLGLKQEGKLEIYAQSKSETGDTPGVQPHSSGFAYVCSYPILAMSGGPGPKLKRGDNQVPEGFYKLKLEPNTPFHLALRLNYPNESDLMHAAQDGRLSPGSDIMIHGNQCSAGCLAMGDPASEDLFTLVYDTGESNVEVVLVPHDFRTTPDMDAPKDSPPWVKDLYVELSKRIETLKKN